MHSTIASNSIQPVSKYMKLLKINEINRDKCENDEIIQIANIYVASLKESHYLACANKECKRKKVEFNESGEPICLLCNNLSDTLKVLILNVIKVLFKIHNL